MDRDEIAQLLGGLTGQVGEYNPVGQFVPAREIEGKANAQRAKKLLRAAGYFLSLDDPRIETASTGGLKLTYHGLIYKV